MKAQKAFGLAYGWPRLSVVFLLDVAALVVASHWPGTPSAATYAWWVGVGVAVLVAILALVTYRRVPLGTALVSWVRGRFADPEPVLEAGRTTPTDHRRRCGRELVGIREHDGALVSVIAVDPPPGTPPGRHHREESPPATLPVDVVAAGLRQFDVRLDGIDVVSVGTQQYCGTWLVLRMDPQRNVAAVAARDSLAATLAAAAERLAHHLDGHQLSARPLTGAELAEVDTAVLADLQAVEIRPGRRRLKRAQESGEARFVSSFWVSPPDITADTLESLWLPETDATVVTVRLGRQRGHTEVSAFVRYHTGAQLPKEDRAGLNRLTGRQLAAVCASLPVPVAHPVLTVPARELRADEHLVLPIGRSPQYLGSEVGAQP